MWLVRGVHWGMGSLPARSFQLANYRVVAMGSPGFRHGPTRYSEFAAFSCWMYCCSTAVGPVPGAWYRATLTELFGDRAEKGALMKPSTDRTSVSAAALSPFPGFHPSPDDRRP